MGFIMCAHDSKKVKGWLTTPVIFALMILLGLLSGWSEFNWLHQLGLFIAEVFVRIFKCISLPIISLSIIVTLSNYRADGPLRTIWQRAMCYTLGTTLIAAMVSCVLYIFIRPSMVGVIKNSALALKPNDFDYVSHLSNLIPVTMVTPFLENQVFGVLLISILFGIAIRFIPEQEARETVTHFFRGLHGLLMVITNWVIKIIPLGMFGFIVTTVVELRGGMVIKGIGEYLMVVVLANLVQGLVILPLWLKANGIKPFETMRKMSPALSLAFFSKSSVGTLPVTMDTAEKNLQVDPAISRFVLPLCTSLNMNGCAAFIFATVIYLMQNHGMVVSLPMMGLWVIIATIAAIGNAGVPMGCFFLSASLLASMNVPILLMGIILPFYSLIDMLETALNVWSDSCVVKVVNEKAASNSGVDVKGATFEDVVADS